MRGVGVVVNPTVEDGSGILSDGSSDESLTTRVVCDELADIVNHASNSNPGLSILRLGNEVVPADNRQVLEGNTPVQCRTLLVELLLQLLESALLDLVGWELLEVIGKAELLASPDEPLGGVVLPPFDSIAEVAGELVVEAS